MVVRIRPLHNGTSAYVYVGARPAKTIMLFCNVLSYRVCRRGRHADCRVSHTLFLCKLQITYQTSNFDMLIFLFVLIHETRLTFKYGFYKKTQKLHKLQELCI
jgi:hypothetical protein